MAGIGLAGLAGFGQGFMQGWDKAEDREQLKKDREYQQKQRDFEQGQQKRKLDEQSRADALRDADAAVQTTEEIDDPNWKPAPPSETAVAQVNIGEDGTETVTPAQASQQAPKIKRQRSWDSIYRDYAANRQKAGDTPGALEFTDKANKVAAQRSANAFLQVQAEAGNKTPLELAQEIGKIFDADPLNGGTKSIEPIEGGVRMTLYNKDTQQTSTREFKGPNASKDLLAAFTPYFRSESYAKLLDKKVEIEAEIAKDPYKQVPGGYIDKRTGRFTATMVGQDIIGYNADGSPIYGSKGQGGAGSGSSGAGGTGGTGGKAVDPFKAATDAVEFAIDKSSAKGALEPHVVARANTMGRQLVSSAAAEGRSLDPSVAAELAINAATGKAPIVPAFNPRTGTIDNVVEYQGNKFSVESFGSPVNSRLDPKQMSGIATGFINSLPQEQRGKLVAAAYNKDGLAKLNAEIEQRARAPEAVNALAQRLGRQPTEDEIRKTVTDAQNAVRPSLELISRYTTLTDDGKKLTSGILKSAGYTSDGKGLRQDPPAAAAPSRIAPGAAGMKTDPQSPAGRSQAMQERMRQEAAQREQKAREDQAALSRQFQQDKAALDPLALAQKYDSLRSKLPTADAAELQRIERNIR